MTPDPSWFAHAVFYEVLPRSFADSSGDGIGDFAGLESRLDYLEWLGVDCLWLPPFFPSPWADGGYDVRHHTNVDPAVGTLADFDAFVAVAHHRGIRVIIDFVMNHTSDQHPWFQASRSDPEGPFGDFYVWRDDDTEYSDARIIFLDTEPSNWSWDEVRQQYYWHRFFHHQPDLNYDNPAVLARMLDALRFWLRRGVDGFRLDAVPYLIERPGTNGENLPETHAILKQVRAMCDEEFPEAVLLCEANQWPHDVVEYFGDGDECHLAFHFPVMPRMYMALRRQDRQCLSDILNDTPFIPRGCQWGTFLRNHDELTLEMVSDADRDYMWAEYAPEPRMRANLGIRRRLAPLLDNDPGRIRLLHSLLLALPGSPVLYYGDEIGMGDDIWLPDRDGVRTPMQWTADNVSAGWSSADPDSFVLPVIHDPAHRPDRVNVADQQQDPMSLLTWVRQALDLRKRHPVMSVGNYVDVGGSDAAVFAFLRSLGDEAMLCAFNLADEERTTELDLGWLAGAQAVHVWSGVEVAAPADKPYAITLPPHGFTWIRLTGFTRERMDVWWEFLQTQRWFSGKQRPGHLEQLRPLGWLTPTNDEGVPTLWPALRPVLADVQFDDGTAETYQILASYRPVTDKGPQGVGVVSVDGWGPCRVADIADDPDALTHLADALQTNRVQDEGWELHVQMDDTESMPAGPGRVMAGEQSNTTVVLGDVLVKILRRIDAGPLVEVRALEALRGVECVPGLRGSVTGRSATGEDVPLAVMTTLVPDAIDGWEHALEQARTRQSTAWSRGIGQSLAAVHARLRERLGHRMVSGAVLRDSMVSALDAAISTVPVLAEHRESLAAIYDDISSLEVEVQHIHGDFHLGQTLLGANGWHIIDFEGEPMAAAADRGRQNPVWRDVAGMLRSIDYARASAAEADTPGAREWAGHVREAFCEGYVEAGGHGLDGEMLRLVQAHEASKAVYEVVYEAHNRPAWLQIPLRAVATLVKDGDHE